MASEGMLIAVAFEGPEPNGLRSHFNLDKAVAAFRTHAVGFQTN